MSHPSHNILHDYPQYYALDRPRSRHSSTAYPSDPYMYGSHSRNASLSQPSGYGLSHSPTSDDGVKPSLPSISNLLSIRSDDEASQEAGERQETCMLLYRLTLTHNSRNTPFYDFSTATTIPARTVFAKSIVAAYIADATSCASPLHAISQTRTVRPSQAIDTTGTSIPK